MATTQNFYERGDGYFTGNVEAKGTLKASDYLSGTGSITHTSSGSVARTDTSAKTLFTLPANAVISAIRYYSAAASNAGTSATLTMGKNGGTGAEYITGADVKTAATGAGLVTPNSGVLGTVGASAVTVTGTYAETGGASSSGGPWVIYVDFTTS